MKASKSNLVGQFLSNNTSVALDDTVANVAINLEAKAYIETLKGNLESECLFRILDDKAKQKKEAGIKLLPHHAKPFYGTLPELNDELTRFNQQGYAVFCTVNVTTGEKCTGKDITGVLAFFVEKDIPGDIPSFHLEPSLVVVSSTGKYHIYWKIDTPQSFSPETFSQYQKRLIAYYDSDPACSDIGRMLRVPGFNHNKSLPPVPTRLLKASGQRYTVDEIFADIPDLKTKTPVNQLTTCKKLDEIDISGLYENQHKETISIFKLLSEKSISFLNGDFSKAVLKDNGNIDRSLVLSSVIYDCKGWESLLEKINVGITENIYTLLASLGNKLGYSPDEFKRHYSSCNKTSVPAVAHQRDIKYAWIKLFFADKEVYKKQAPLETQDVLNLEDTQHDSKREHQVNGGQFLNPSFKSSDKINASNLNEWVNNNIFTPTETIDQPYFDCPNIPDKGVIVAARAGMGSGKTYFAQSQIKEENAKGRGAFQIAPRVKLNAQFVSRGAERGIKITMLSGNVNQEEELSINIDENIALCPESLMKIERFIDGRDCYIDEACSVFEQILSGGTVSGTRQTKCMELMKAIVRLSNRVFVFDANLDNKLVDMISSFAPEKKVIKIGNLRKPTPSTFNFLESVEIYEDGSEKKVKVFDQSPIIRKACEAEKPFIMTDSKKLSTLLDEMLQNRGKAGFFINKDTSSETWGELFKRNIVIKTHILKLYPRLEANQDWLSQNWVDEFMYSCDDFLIRYQPQYLGGTPTIESGVSIELKPYFTEKIGIFCGVLLSKQITQMLFRVRDNSIPGFISCPKVSQIRSESLPQYDCTYLKEYEIEVIQEYIAMGINPTAKQVREAASQRIDPVWDDYRINLMFNAHWERQNLRDSLIYRLESMGHSCKIGQVAECEETKEELRDLKEAQLEAKVERFKTLEIFNSKEEYEKAKKEKPGRETDERHEKTKVFENLPGINETEEWNDSLIKKIIEDNNLHKPHDRYLMLTTPEMSEKLEDYFSYLSSSKEKVTFNSLVKDESFKIKGLKDLGVDKLISIILAGEGIHKDTTEVRYVIDTARKAKKKKGIPLPPKGDREVMKYIKELLLMAGVPLGKGEQKTINSTLIRIYKLNEKAFNEKTRLAIIRHREIYWKTFFEQQYKTPDWEYLSVNGKIPENFRTVLPSIDSEDITSKTYTKLKEREAEISRWLEDFKACRNSHRDLMSLIKVCEKGEYGEINTGIYQEILKRVDSSFKTLLNELKTEIDMQSQIESDEYSEIYTDLIENWNNREFLKGYCEYYGRETEDWNMIIQKLPFDKANELEKINLAIEAEKLSTKLKVYLGTPPSYNLIQKKWDNCTLALKHKIKEFLSPDEYKTVESLSTC